MNPTDIWLLAETQKKALQAEKQTEADIIKNRASAETGKSKRQAQLLARVGAAFIAVGMKLKTADQPDLVNSVR